MVKSVWMSHGDRVESIPSGFEKIAISENSPYAAIADTNRNIYAVQFHPRSLSSECETNFLKILQNIFVDVKALGIWVLCKENKLTKLKVKLEIKSSVCAVVSWVDSSCCTLLVETIGNQVIPVLLIMVF